jgi:hypothetical protein
MIGKKEPRELKPGDLYLKPFESLCDELRDMIVGEETFFFGIPKNEKLRLVCRHPCGALEFLILDSSKEFEPCGDIPMSQDISS